MFCFTEENRVTLKPGESYHFDNVFKVEELWKRAGKTTPDHILSFQPKITLMGKEIETSYSKAKRAKYETIDFTEGTDAKSDLVLEVDGFNFGVNKAILGGIFSL